MPQAAGTGAAAALAAILDVEQEPRCIPPARPTAEARWCFTALGDESLVFTSPTGAPLRHGNFRRRVWLAAVKTAGVPAIHFHDLRHTGNHLTAEAGATLRELMDRMGHSTTGAAKLPFNGLS